MSKENIVVLTDEHGNETQFEFLDLISYKQKEYVVLLPVDSFDDQVVILQIEGANEEIENYISVDNEYVLETVFSLFKERNKDYFTFE